MLDRCISRSVPYLTFHRINLLAFKSIGGMIVILFDLSLWQKLMFIYVKTT